MQHVIILCPLYNDEESFRQFAAHITTETAKLDGYRFSLLLVNDGSIQKPVLTASLPLTILHLHRNLGHQKALAIGLSYAWKELVFDNIIVMDCDGEDRPADLGPLLNAGSSGIAAVARRRKRQEGARFRMYYLLYKFFFRLLTGGKISFGNFMVLPKKEVGRLVHHSEIWSHLAGGLLKSGIAYTTVTTDRGKRYAGSSKMNFPALLLHGLGAIGVFIEVIAGRLLVFSVTMICLSLLAIAIVVAIRFFTDLAIPGWATTAVSSLLIVLLQSFLLSLFTIFLYLSSQAQRKIIPAHHYADYVQSVETAHG